MATVQKSGPAPAGTRRQVPQQPTRSTTAKAGRAPAAKSAATAAKATARPPVGEPMDPPARTVNGLKVVDDTPTPSPLSRQGKPVMFSSLRLLTLADGSTVTGCADCEFTGSRGEVRAHRWRAHGEAKPGRKSAAATAGDPPVNLDMGAMTLQELYELARSAGSWGDMFAGAEQQIEEWRKRALAAESWKRKVTVRLAQLGFKLDPDADETP